MRIDAYNQVAALYQAKKPVSVNKTSKVEGPRDQVQISQAGKDYQIAKQAVANASDIREDKVAEVKSKINSGNYNVDSDDFASQLMDKMYALA